MTKVCLACAATNRFKWLPCPQHSPATNPEDCTHELTSHVIHANAAWDCSATICHACNTYADNCTLCEDCGSSLDQTRPESYYTPALCDDCNLDRAIALEVTL